MDGIIRIIGMAVVEIIIEMAKEWRRIKKMYSYHATWAQKIVSEVEKDSGQMDNALAFYFYIG